MDEAGHEDTTSRRDPGARATPNGTPSPTRHDPVRTRSTNEILDTPTLVARRAISPVAPVSSIT